MATMQSVVPHFAEHGGGAIVNIASANAFKNESPEAPYNASKAALVALTKAAAHEWGHLGIRANCVAPGQTVTPEGAAEIANDPRGGPAPAASTCARSRCGAPACPRDQAMAVLFLASDDAAWITGQTIIVDGGELGGGDWYDRADAPPLPGEDRRGVSFEGLSHTRADLEIAAFAVDEVVEGTLTGRDGTTLLVASPQLAVGAGEPALAEATVEVVRPGDRVRLTNVLDAVVPDVRADDPDATFPGMLGGAWDEPASPRIHRLSGVAVLPVCDWEAAGFVAPEEFPPSYVDMAGPGKTGARGARPSNVVVRCVPARGVPVAEADAAIRRAALGLARALAATTLDATPDDVRHVGDARRRRSRSARGVRDPAGRVRGAARRHVLRRRRPPRPDADA